MIAGWIHLAQVRDQ